MATSFSQSFKLQAGLRGTASASQQLLVEATGSEQAGTLIYAGLDLGASVGGLVRSIPKINSLGNPYRSLFVRDPASFEPAINQATRNALTIEVFSSGSAILFGSFGVRYEDIFLIYFDTFIHVRLLQRWIACRYKRRWL